MTYEQIQYETRGEVALLTLHRPEKLNAWTPRMAVEMADAFARANDDRGVGAIVVTGAGRGFCAGADMQDTFKSRIDGVDPGENTAEGDGGMPAGLDWVKLCRESKPLVAAVNGAAVGIGMTMILPFDVIVASEKAKFGMLFIKVGLGETRVEVLIPRDETSGTAKFLMRRGPGLHHLGYAVENVAQAAAELRSRGVSQIDLRDGGANENNAAFFVPRDCMGILTELVPEVGPSLPRG